MKNSFSKFAKNIAEKIYKYFGDDSGHMLLMTSIIGTMASCLAQTGAIVLNKKYTDSQKTFMVPQELTEGCVTILSIFLITKPIQSLIKKCVSSGKLANKDMIKYMEKHNLIEKRGCSDFDFSLKVKEAVEKIKKTDVFIKSTELEKENLLSEHKNILENYDVFMDSASAIATTVGGATSLAVVSPLLRNYVASKFQKASLDYQKLNSDNVVNKEQTYIQCNLKNYNQNVCKI